MIHASEQDRPDVRLARERWRAGQVGLDPARLVFIDETWAKTNMTRRYGWCASHQRLTAKVPHGHWMTTTFIAALRLEGLTAPLVIDGPVDGELFLAYVRQQLVPTLHRADLVVMDNLSSHKVAGVRDAIADAGATLVYLPAYSPDLNPIEQVFSKVKSVLRQSEQRTRRGLWNRLGEIVDLIEPDECQRYFRHCGYNAMRL